jgi:hypothetical protein
MKIIITGHTSGIGKYLYDHYSNNHEVIGVSRSTGYDLSSDIDAVVNIASNCDLFINNCYVNTAQAELLDRLHSSVKQMIVFGSIAGTYHTLIQSDYSKNKMELSTRCKELSLIPGTNILHVNISMLEDAVSGDTLIKYKEVLDLLNFWISNPIFTNIDYQFKLTPYTITHVKEKFNASQEAIDQVIKNMCDINRDKFQ